MRFTVVTILPELIEPSLAAGVVGRAREAGVLGEPASADDKSFSAGLLEYPQYTRPPDLDGRGVPPVLTSGNHAAIAAWRRLQAMQRTALRRPDLWRRFRPTATAADRKALP